MTLDPITLSGLARALAGVAEEMGALLVRAALSSNVKERRDCSTALFDANGRLVAQAAHIPVHLGAMPDAVAAVLAHDPEPGDVFCLNDPFAGGTHLPDVTLVSPVAIGDEVVAFAASRAHHSDVGGMAPGSMPATSRDLLQEGIVIPPVRLVRGGAWTDDVLALILANVRTPDIRRGDLRAQVASHRLAERRLEELAARHEPETLLAAFADVVAYAERRAREAIAAVRDGEYRAEDVVEGDGVTNDDIPIRVRVSVAGDALTIDFAGTAAQVPGNVNCPLAVTRSACAFALRVVLPEDVPTNAGTFAPLTVLAPDGTVVNARRPAAVAAGNVETSQRIADTVLLALGQAADVSAQGQGTMNNVVVGGSGWTYYETVGGGQGASSRGPGASGVHVGMSNTLNTPVEALELEFPLRIERYELREGSGGAGRYQGGDGNLRALRVLEPATLSLLADRRRHPPRGGAGGRPGTTGENLVNRERLPAKATRELKAGDRVEVRTPGGGGWGAGRTTG